MRILLTLTACLATTLSFSSATAQIVAGDQDLGAIWFVGDSITQSNADGDSNGSPRSELYELLNDSGYSFSFTGHRTNNPEGLPVTGSTPATNLHQYHSGISGSVIGDNSGNRTGMTQNLASHWNSGRLATVKPSIILIMLGTNDISNNIDIANAPSRLSNYIDQIYTQPGVGNPSIFVASIPPNGRSTTQSNNVISFNSAVPGVVSAQQALGRDVHFVDQFTPLNDNFDELMRSDQLHTNAAGNASLAQQWFDGINSIVSLEEPTPPETVYIGDAASEGQTVIAGNGNYSLPVLSIVNLSDGMSAAPVIYTSPIDQTLELTEVNFYTGPIEGEGTLTPFVVRILGAAADGSFDGQLGSSFEILQGVPDYINQGDSITRTTDGTLTSDGDFAFDRSLSFNIGFIPEATSALGDFDMDGDVDLADLDRYIGNIGASADGDLQALDLDGNGTVDARDFEQHFGELVEAGGIQGTLGGDANLDGVVNVLGDALLLVQNLGNNAATSWAQGDFNGDGVVNVLGDALLLVQNLGQSNAP